MTWGEFKAMVEAAGVKPDDEIDYIDITSFGWGINFVTEHSDESGTIHVSIFD